MAFIKQITAPNGAITQYHKIAKIELLNNNLMLNVQVSSWPNEQTYNTGTPALWNWYLTVSSDELYNLTQQKIILTETFLSAQIVGEQAIKTPEELLADQWALVKVQRDQLLTQTDWRVIRAVDQGIPLDEAWKTYRQALRDVTTQPDPFNITWPEPPTA